MPYLRCDCIINAGLSDAASGSFYNQNFVPQEWELNAFGPLTEGVSLLLKGYCKDCYRDLAVQFPIPKQDSEDAVFQHIYDTIRTAHPYDKTLETKPDGKINYYGSCKERSEYYRARDTMPVSYRNREFLDLFPEYHRERARLWLERKFPPQAHTEVYRDTGGSLFCSVVRMAKEHGDFEKVTPILDYVLPNEHEGRCGKPVKLTAYGFDFIAIVNFGGSEGIYLDCYLRGKFDESGRYQLNVGTIKTLRRDLEAMKLMGELGGILTYYADRYVNQHLHRYTPLAQLRAEAERMKAADSTERTEQA